MGILSNWGYGYDNNDQNSNEPNRADYEDHDHNDYPSYSIKNLETFTWEIANLK